MVYKTLISRFSEKIHMINFPAKNITNCVFGGINNSVLYVTSATKSMSVEEMKKYKYSGALFKIKTIKNL